MKTGHIGLLSGSMITLAAGLLISVAGASLSGPHPSVYQTRAAKENALVRQFKADSNLEALLGSRVTIASNGTLTLTPGDLHAALDTSCGGPDAPKYSNLCVAYAQVKQDVADYEQDHPLQISPIAYAGVGLVGLGMTGSVVSSVWWIAGGIARMYRRKSATTSSPG